MRTIDAQRILVLSSVVGFSCAATGCTSSPAVDYRGYSSTEELVEATDVIVEATILSSRHEISYPEIDTSGDPRRNPQAGLDPEEIDLESMGVPITVTTVEVVDSLKGTVGVGDRIDVTQVGGAVDGAEHDATSTVLLSHVGTDTVLLLLSQDGDRHELITPGSGVQTLGSDGTTIVPATDADGEITSTDLDLTLPALRSLISENP